MDDKQKREKQQNTFRRIHKASINIKHFTVNVIVAISCIAAVVNIFHCLRIESRNQKENEQLVLSVIVLACFLLLGVLNNFLADKILDKFLIAINRKCDNKNKQAIKKIRNLNEALYQISKCNGVVIWDTLWGTCACFMAAVLIVFLYLQ